jgi:hypothetical protein
MSAAEKSRKRHDRAHSARNARLPRHIISRALNRFVAFCNRHWPWAIGAVLCIFYLLRKL